MVLPLRVCLDEQAGENLPAQWAHTLDISHIGCRLGGLRTELSPGQTITLQRGQHKASFRVIWSKQLAAHEYQAGIEALDYGREIWGVELPPSLIANSSTEHSSATRDSSKPVTSASLPVASKAPSPGRNAVQKFISFAARPRRRWGLVFGLLLLTFLALGWAFYQGGSNSFGRLAIQPPVPAPPTAQDLARLTPKSHRAPVLLAAALTPSASRLQVAEAPTAHVVYPVAPDESISGKVHLQVVIAANGLVKQIHVLSGNQSLAQAAAEAVRLWHYGSLQGSDQSREREISVTVSFRGADAVVLEFPSTNAQHRAN